MANIIRTTKKIVDPATGIIKEVEVEKDSRTENALKRWDTASKIQRELGIHLDSRNTSTIGAGKKTGNMKKSTAAQTYKGAITNKAWRNRRHQKNARKLTEVIS